MICSEKNEINLYYDTVHKRMRVDMRNAILHMKEVKPTWKNVKYQRILYYFLLGY